MKRPRGEARAPARGAGAEDPREDFATEKLAAATGAVHAMEKAAIVVACRDRAC